MKCSRLNLLERANTSRHIDCPPKESGYPRWYCQKRMVNPDHDEDPRWSVAVLENKLHFNVNPETEESWRYGNKDVMPNNCDQLFLSVLNLQFQGTIEKKNQPRSFFKYKSATNKDKHRMFIKEVVSVDNRDVEDGRMSIDRLDYLDDYVNCILNTTEFSQPSTNKSNQCFGEGSDLDRTKHKVMEVESDKVPAQKKIHFNKTKDMINTLNDIKHDKETSLEIDDFGDTKIKFHNTGKRKSLTISRTQSPETVQVIRVDVYCNNSNSSSVISANKEEKTNTHPNNLEHVSKSYKDTQFVNKYLLMKTVKTLDENICGRSKVTLMCKTFKLADRYRQNI